MTGRVREVLQMVWGDYGQGEASVGYVIGVLDALRYTDQLTDDEWIERRRMLVTPDGEAAT